MRAISCYNAPMADFIHIKELENAGPVTAVYSTSNVNRWPSYETGEEESDYDRAAGEFGVTTSRLIRLPQVHSSKIRVIKKEHAGEGVVRRVSIEGFDGMITNEPGIVLCTVEADCVPVYLYDPVRAVIGMVHSGWKGSAGQISSDAINKMVNEFGSDPGDILALIGPCICGKCYEVGGELKDDFLKNYSSDEVHGFFAPRENGKFLLDLKKAIRLTFLRSGITKEHIYDTDVCTFESSEICSWRRDKDKMARMLTAIMLKR